MIDSHVHFWNYHPVKEAWITEEMKAIQADFLPDQLQKELAANGIEGCVAVQADQSEQETKFLLSLATNHDFIKGVVGWIDLRSEHLSDRLVAYSKYEKLKGWRHIAQPEPDGFLLSPSFLRGIAELKNYSHTYDIVIGRNQLKEAISLVDKFPDQRFVLDHIAKPDIKGNNGDVAWKEGISLLATHKNLYCKVSGMVTEADWYHWKHEDMKFYLDTVFENFSTNKLMFGSDWPVCTLAANYKQTKEIVEDHISQLTALQRRAIFELNAKECYQL